jgi:hypothetical protein
MNLVNFLLVWARSLEEWLGSNNVTMMVGESPQNIAKPSGWVTLASTDRESELIVWESGEAEFARSIPGDGIVQEHHDLGGIEDLGRLLSRLLMSIT